jgi:hypothetical protein
VCAGGVRYIARLLEGFSSHSVSGGELSISKTKVCILLESEMSRCLWESESISKRKAAASPLSSCFL